MCKTADRLDIVVFGASGFTGKFTLPQVYKLGKVNGKNASWGVAGRSEYKLKNVLVETAKRIGVDNLNAIPIIIANVADEESIQKMTACAKIIINCCGPYQLYGEVVVKACIESGTHYVDVSAESLFKERIEEKYHKAAEEKGVYIISACGFDSIPADLGVIFLENNFEGTLNSIESVLYAYEEGDTSTGSAVNFGTWDSIVRFVGDFWELLAQRKRRNLKTLPEMLPKLHIRWLRRINIEGEGNKWIVPVPTPDRDNVLRSQRYFYKHNNKRPVQMHSYLAMDSFIYVLKLFFFAQIFIILGLFHFGRCLLLKYPELFSDGYFSHTAPSEDRLERGKFSFTFYGKGWSKLADPNTTVPNKIIVGRLSASNPGYGFTCVALTLSVLSLKKLIILCI